jgi:hypothetical protein
MSRSRRLGEGSTRDANWQAEEYRRLMGDEKADRQEHLAKLEQGQCTCKRRTVKVRGLFYTLHRPECTKHKPWMEEIERDIRERDEAIRSHVDAVRPF